MSDVEEPPTKMTKIEIELTELSTEQNASMESVGEGQEEWLSEGLITDDDYNTSQDTSIQESTQDINQDVSQETTHFADETEANETQENHELSVEITQAAELAEAGEASDQLSPTFTQDLGSIVHDDEQNNDPEPTQEESTTQVDDPEHAIQNDTAAPEQNVTEPMESSEQTEESLMNTVEATLDKMEHDEEPKERDIKNEQDLLDDLDTFLIRKAPTEHSSLKAEVEDDGHNTDELLEMLGEDERTKKKIGLKTVNRKATLATAESSDEDTFQGEVKTLKLAKNAIIKRRGQPTKVEVYDSDVSSEEASGSAFKPTKKHVLTKTSSNSLLKTQSDKKVTATMSTSTPLRTYSRSRMPRTRTEPRSLLKPSRENESNEEQEAKEEPSKQRIMKPEQMEEEVVLDSDHSDESFYDELPSSDSEDVEEWFALDIRAELAGDYIPLLGYKAYDILTEEKRRVSKKLSQLREGLSVLNESTKRNMKEIEITRRKLDDLEGELSLA